MTEPMKKLLIRKKIEDDLRVLARDLKTKVKPNQGFVLLLADYGVAGNTAYCSSMDRLSGVAMVDEWLATMRPQVESAFEEQRKRYGSLSHAVVDALELPTDAKEEDIVEEIHRLKAIK